MLSSSCADPSGTGAEAVASAVRATTAACSLEPPSFTNLEHSALARTAQDAHRMFPYRQNRGRRAVHGNSYMFSVAA
jgi:hypothetical protein